MIMSTDKLSKTKNERYGNVVPSGSRTGSLSVVRAFCFWPPASVSTGNPARSSGRSTLPVMRWASERLIKL